MISWGLYGALLYQGQVLLRNPLKALLCVGIAYLASVQGTVALGRQRGARIARLGDPPEAGEAPALGRCHARSHGFDPHAGLVVPAGQRERLERVCRYTLRPPVAGDRLRVTGDGQVRLHLRHRWTDGTRRTWCSIRSSSWDGWRCSCRDRGST